MAKRWFTYDSRQSFMSSGVNEACWLVHRSVGRQNSDISPYLVANELICGYIGQSIRLPIPPFALMRSGPTAKGLFASLNIGSRTIAPRDAVPSACYAAHPKTCVGILLFDIFIGNSDRHSGNLKVDLPSNPTRIDVIDHDRALFGAVENEGLGRLSRLITRLGVTGASAAPANRHCLIDVVHSAQHFDEWAQRIEQIPDWFITDVCHEAERVPITPGEAEAAAQFLRDRKRRLNTLIKATKTEFPRITDWGLAYL